MDTDSTSLQLLLDSFVAVASERDVDAILERAVDLARLSTRARYGAAVIVDHGQVRNFVHQGLTRAQVEQMPHPPEGKGLLSTILEGTPVRVARLHDGAGSLGLPVGHEAVEAFLGVPVWTADELVGALYVGQPPGQQPFTDQDELFVHTLASQVGVAIDACAAMAQKEREIADRGKAQMLVRILQAVAVASNEADTLEDALRACIEEVCAQTGWHVGHAFVVEGDRLVPTDVWHLSDPERFEPFREVTMRTSYERGVGLMGRIFETGRPTWLAPMGPGHPAFPRSTEVHDCGLSTVYGFPVVVGGEVVAVLEFFSLDTLQLDPQLLEVMGHVVVQLGRVVERVDAAASAQTYATELELANERLVVANQVKSDFVSMASHELRTPLTSILGFASTMLAYWDETPDEAKHEYLAVIDRQAQRLSRLVNDLLAMSRIEAGSLTARQDEIDLAAAIGQALADLGDRAADVVTDVPPGTMVVADPDHLQQILVNYLSNAVKYGGPPIEVTVAVAAGGASVELAVRDHGEGVPPEFVPHLFEKFSQASTGSTRRAAGTGLGLSIVLGLVAANGGEAWYEPPADGPGARFCVRLPGVHGRRR
jgi:signal transduction histidine kinase